MLDISQIMKDLASMVHEQGDTIGKTFCVCVPVCVLRVVYIVSPDSISKDNLCCHVFNLTCLINNVSLKMLPGKNKLCNLDLAATPWRFFDEERDALGLFKQQTVGENPFSHPDICKRLPTHPAGI